MSQVESKSPKLNEIIDLLRERVNLVGRTAFLKRTTVSRPELWRILKGEVVPKADTLLLLLEAAQLEVIVQ